MDVKIEQTIGDSQLNVPLVEVKVDSISNISDCNEKRNEDADSDGSGKDEFNVMDRTSNDVDTDDTSKLSGLFVIAD